MNNNLVRIKDNDNLVRDVNTKAIINISDNKSITRKKNAEIKRMNIELSKIPKLEDEVKDIKKSISNIEKLLEHLVLKEGSK